jgi:hypothetical protein
MSDEPEALPTPESIAEYVKKNAPKVKKSGMLMMAHGDPVVLREDDYQGHHITVKTTYHMEVDGKPLMGHLAVTNEGQVQYHGLPNYSFDSAIFLIRKLIDTFPDDFKAGGGESAEPEMPDMPGMTGMAGMPGMGSKKPAKAAKKKPAPRKAK